MPDAPERRAPRRFARLYSDGSMVLTPPCHDFFAARQELVSSRDDDETELLEVEVSVIRTHGRPKLQVVREHSARCPTCGDTVFIEVPTHE